MLFGDIGIEIKNMLVWHLFVFLIYSIYNDYNISVVITSSANHLN